MNAVSPLRALAEDFSPRYQCHRDDLVTVDIRGLDRLLGDPRSIGEEIRRSALGRGLRVHIAIATTRTSAMVLALARPGLTVVPRGREADAIAPMAIGILEKIAEQPPSTPSAPRRRESTRSVSVDQPPGTPRTLDPKDSVASVISVVKRWGLRTLGELAALPSSELSARVGRQGLVWQAIARGQDVGPLVPSLADERFESSIELEWPIEGLEPLSFVLTRLLEPLSTRLERRDRGAAAIHVMLGLVVAHDINHRAHREHRESDSLVQNSVNSVASVVALSADTYTRSLQLPSPIRDVRALRTLILLDLESHPPAGPIERVTVTVDPTPGRVLQHALFVRAQPTPEQLSTLIARLNALMGEDRVGRPVRVDSYRPGAFAMQPFATEHDINHRDHRAHREPLHDINHRDHQYHPHPLDDINRREHGARQEPFVGNSVNSVNSVASVVDKAPAASALTVVSALRRCRRPVPARVVVAGDRPVAVTTDRRGFAGGRVLACAGPWRSSGEWWSGGTTPTHPRHPPNPVHQRDASNHAHQPQPAHQPYPSQSSWNRDEWDVSLSDGGVYRIFQDRDTNRWFIDAIVD